MPRAQISERNAVGGDVDQFESLKLDTGDYARLLVPVDEGWWEYVHSMRAPVIDDEGFPSLVTKTRKDNSTYSDWNMGFVGQRVCLGDPSVIEEKGMDARNCPACAAAERGIKGMSPEQRWAIPVIRYTTKKKNTTDLQNPPGATVLVWKLSQRMYRMLVKDTKREIRELLDLPEEQEFSLRAADIVVFCEDGGFQRVIFKAPMRPAYRHPAVGELIAGLWGDESNRPTDAQLKAACGRSGLGDREYMTIDVDQVVERWKKAERHGKDGIRRGDPTGDGPVAGSQDLDAGLDGLDSLLNGQAPPDPFGDPAPVNGSKPAAVVDDPFNTPAAAQPAAVATDPFGDSTPAPATAPPAGTDPFGDAPVAAAAPAAQPPGKVASFDDILSS